MTVKELYKRLNGSYDVLMRIIPTEDLVIYFTNKFLLDSSYNELMISVHNNDVIKSFEASHKLKGIVGNLCFTSLYDAVYDLTEHLRKKPELIDMSLVNTVSERYNLVIDCIKDFNNERN